MKRAVPWLTAGLGLTAVVAGVGVFVVAGRAPVGDFGWSAYAPLEEVGVAHDSSLVLTFDDRWTVLWNGGHLLGAGLVVAGLLALAVLVGWLLGRGRPRSRGVAGP